VDLRELGTDVDWPDSEASTAVRERLAGQTALGRLASLAEWAIGVRPPGSSFHNVRALVVGAEPPPLVIDTAAAVDAQVVGVPAEGGTQAGVAIADDAIERGTELLIVAVPGLGADAAITVSVLAGAEPVKVLERGAAATDPEAWMRLAVEVRDGRRRCLPHNNDPDALLAELGSQRLAVAAGAVLRAAGRRTPVLLDGPVATAAALLAYEAQPRAVRWWVVADRGTEPLSGLVLDRISQAPVLGLGTSTGDGLAGLLAVPVLRAATALASG
jgi:nicotinate-nucleotide--dimethylbenzimidazole phosphoribosyltransferase